MGTRDDLVNFLFENDDDKNDINKITEKIIGSSYRVMNELGDGFLEKVYENALAHELRKLGLKVDQQKKIEVIYDNVEVGKYEPDLLVEDAVIVELKTAKALKNTHKAQCLNYLKATRLKICLLINFGNPKVEVNRVAL